MSSEVERPDETITDERSEDEREQERIAAGARAAKSTIVAVAILSIGSMVLMCLFTILVVVLRTM